MRWPESGKIPQNWWGGGGGGVWGGRGGCGEGEGVCLILGTECAAAFRQNLDL